MKRLTLADAWELDGALARRSLAGHAPPLYFLDFESIGLAVPLWAGTRPYEQIPFQFSVHRLDADGTVHHDGFLDLSGKDPSAAIAPALLRACGGSGTVFTYNATFERRMIACLARRNPALAAALEALAARVVDLLPIVRASWYHPEQRGSWSLKAVLPTLVPGRSYDDLEGVHEGGEAQAAWVEAAFGDATPERRAELERQLRRYCALDTDTLLPVDEGVLGEEVLGALGLSGALQAS